MVLAPPIVGLEPDLSQGTVPLVVTFTASDSDQDGDVVSYA